MTVDEARRVLDQAKYGGMSAPDWPPEFRARVLEAFDVFVASGPSEAEFARALGWVPLLAEMLYRLTLGRGA